jgi:hypothetical protein
MPPTVMTSPSTLLTMTNARLQKWNERQRGVLPGLAIPQGRIVLGRGGWSFRHRRAPQSLRLCASAVNNPSPPSLLHGKNVLPAKPSRWTARAPGQKGKRKGEERTERTPQKHLTGLFNNA